MDKPLSLIYQLKKCLLHHNRERVNGYVTNKLPLSHNGNIIDGFKLTFKDGVVVDVVAEQGEEALKTLLSTDEGAKRLGRSCFSAEMIHRFLIVILCFSIHCL